MLCFGDAQGNVYHFYTDTNNPESYNDNGKSIVARWQTAELDGSLFYAAKTFRRFSIRLSAAINTSIQGYYRQQGGQWRPVSAEPLKARYFRFSKLQFSKLCFSGDATDRTLSGKLAVHRTDKVTFCFENDALNEPFGLEALAFEYTQAGRYRS